MALNPTAGAIAASYEPSLEDARSELARELARPEYAAALPNPIVEFLGQAWAAFTEWLAGLGSLAPNMGLVVALVILASVVAAAVLAARPRLRHRAAARDSGVGLEAGTTSEDYRALSASAAADADWATACLHRFRAMVRRAEERTLLDRQPGRTAFEVAGRLEVLFPDEAEGLEWSANLFNAVHYGNHDAGIDDWRRLDALEGRLDVAAVAGSPIAGSRTMAAPR